MNDNECLSSLHLTHLAINSKEEKFPVSKRYSLTQDEKASLRLIRLEREIVRTKGKLIELNRELDALIEEMIP